MSKPTGDCEFRDAFDGTLQIAYCDADHWYYVRKHDGGNLPWFPNAEPEDWIYAPSVTTIGKMLGASKVDGLLYWAVNQTLNYLDSNIEHLLLIPSFERFLDGLQSRAETSLRSGRKIDARELTAILNSLDDLVGLDWDVWNDLKKDAAAHRFTKLQEAGDVGTAVHQWIEMYVNAQMGKGEEPQIPMGPEVVTRGVNRWLEWERASDVHWLYSEQRIYHPDFHYAGTLDAVAILDGVLTLIDFKTSKSVYDEHRLQTAAYVRALELETGMKIEERKIQMISKKTGRIKNISLETGKGGRPISADFDAFLGLRQVFKTLKQT